MCISNTLKYTSANYDKLTVRYDTQVLHAMFRQYCVMQMCYLRYKSVTCLKLATLYDIQVSYVTGWQLTVEKECHLQGLSR